jgi:hypothetical protein
MASGWRKPLQVISMRDKSKLNNYIYTYTVATLAVAGGLYRAGMVKAGIKLPGPGYEAARPV